MCIVTTEVGARIYTNGTRDGRERLDNVNHMREEEKPQALV